MGLRRGLFGFKECCGKVLVEIFFRSIFQFRLLDEFVDEFFEQCEYGDYGQRPRDSGRSLVRCL